MTDTAKTPWHVNDDRPDDAKSRFSISNGDAKIIANVVTYEKTQGLERGRAHADLIVNAVNTHATSQAQIEWLKARLANLQLPANKHDLDTREKWLIECGMPSHG